MRRRATLILVLPLVIFALFPALEPFLHHHAEDGADHHDCPICNMLHATSVTVEPAVAAACLALVAVLPVSAASVCVEPRTVFRPGRSPPSLLSI
jgi:hypothetical protein